MRTPPGVARAALGVLLTASLTALLSSCGGSSGKPTGTPPPTHRHLVPTTPATTTPSTAPTHGGVAATATKVLTFIVENHSQTQMQAGMPYLSHLAQRYAYASDYSAITHPSLPNYLAIAGGSTFGVADDAYPSTNAVKVGPATSVFDQALASGHTAKTYAESMPGNCVLTSSGLYAVKHNPWAYFDAGRANCLKYDVPSGTPTSGALASDVANGTLPDVGMVIPNLCNDAHDCSLSTADSWLQSWLPSILSGPDFTSGRLVVVITADEDNHSQNNHVLTVVLDAASQGGRTVSAPLNHYSLSRLYSQIIASNPLGQARTAPDMLAAFGL
ncbi:MAG: phosphatidylinositol-3-phosphatase [Nocardioidaceae bacterium]|nr:phosphatidylinositol-3-phosphatase [Nocardioidaceae bacterium]